MAAIVTPTAAVDGVLKGKAAASTSTVTTGGYAVLQQGQALTAWKHELPAKLAPHEVEIKVTHNGVCHTDLHMRDNDWFISGYPFIPGHEIVGEVVAVGSEVTTLRTGQRVGCGWIKDSCRGCAHCVTGQENLCYKGYTGLITRGGLGGFQAAMRINADFAFPIPDGLDSADAAPLMCAGITVYAPLKKWLVRPGMEVAVLGLGGLGHLAVQFADKMGAVVTALGRTLDKEAECRALGAAHYEVMDSTAATRLKNKYDIIINCACANVPVGPLLDMLRPDGAMIQTGIPGDSAQITIPLTNLVFGQKKVVGTVVGGRADMNAMLELSAAKRIKPMIEVFPSTQVNEAFARVASGQARYRVVVEMLHGKDAALEFTPAQA